MRKILLIVALFGALVVGWRAFSAGKRGPDVSAITVELDVQRLEQVLFGLETLQEVRALLAAHPRVAAQLQLLLPGGSMEDLAGRLHAMVHDAGVQQLYREVQRVFGDLTAVRRQLTQAFRHMKHYYPTFRVPQIVTFITGMGLDLHVSSEADLVIVGLDFFLGDGGKYRPPGLPQYLLRTYQPANVVPKIMLLLTQPLIKTDGADQTLLADMLHYGRAYYCVQALLPGVPEEVLLGYTREQLAEVYRYQAFVWKHFVEEELLYVTDYAVKKRYLGYRPFTSEVGRSCPGNIGRWLGWAIVKKYVQHHPDVSLPALLANTDARTIFAQSKYRPGP